MDRQPKDRDATSSCSSISGESEAFESTSNSNAKQRSNLIEWMNGIVPDLGLPINASDEELRECLIDGSVLCLVLDKLKPGSLSECGGGSDHSSPRGLGNVQRFLSAMDVMGVPRFQTENLEKGSMKIVLDCLLTLKTRFKLNAERYNEGSALRKVNTGGVRREESVQILSSPTFGEGKRKLTYSKSLRTICSPFATEPSTALTNHAGHKFHEVFQHKQGTFTDLPAAYISEMIKSNSLDNAPTQSLLSVINGILDESIDLKKGEIPHRVGCLLRKVVQEVERRICTQAEHMRTQNNLYKSREEKYQSRIKFLEAARAVEEMQQNSPYKANEEKSQPRLRVIEPFATGTFEETKNEALFLPIVMNQPQQLKSEKNRRQEKNELEEPDIIRLMKEKDELNQVITTLRQALEIAMRSRDEQSSKKNVETGGTRHEMEDRLKEDLSSPTKSRNRVMELEDKLKKSLSFLAESENKVKELESRLKESLSFEAESGNRVKELEDRLKEALSLQTESENRVNELEPKLKETLRLPTESVNRVHELEDRLKESLSLQTKSGNKVKELEDRLKEALSLQTESGNRVMELEDRLKESLSLQTKSGNKVKELEDRLKEALSLQTESGNRVMELEGRLKETLSLLTESGNTVKDLEARMKEDSRLQTELRNRVKELEAFSKSISEQWSKKQKIFHIFTDTQLGALRELRLASQPIQQELLRTQKSYSEEFTSLGSRIKVLDDAANNYYVVLAENRKLHNEIQELKGNIRVYCRIRPFLPGQKGKQSIVEHAGENGELIVLNPSKQGKEGRRSFKFDKVYGSKSTQEDVFSDIQPLVQSVLDGYNVCIFAYGQSGSGKTYTMTGPEGATGNEWGVNYRALNDLFRISQSRKINFKYEVSVQMIEIYNEQVRDLLSGGSSQKRLGISMQPSGLAVPDASIRTVNSTSDVLELMDIGLKNRAKSTTALNERSSRSHSVVSVHAHGIDLKSGSSLRASLHLVDLAGSERVDRSEVTGDKLKEAQHINKSLSALGDVIFALSQKSSHIPYRNSKLTQVLQSSLGGQAKTLMFVQLNPDLISYSESISTLKFAERVAGVELGAAKSSKDGRDVRELMEQVSSLKDTIAKKDEEIETLNLLKDSGSGANPSRN